MHPAPSGRIRRRRRRERQRPCPEAVPVPAAGRGPPCGHPRRGGSTRGRRDLARRRRQRRDRRRPVRSRRPRGRASRGVRGHVLDRRCRSPTGATTRPSGWRRATRRARTLHPDTAMIPVSFDACSAFAWCGPAVLGRVAMVLVVTARDPSSGGRFGTAPGLGFAGMVKSLSREMPDRALLRVVDLDPDADATRTAVACGRRAARRRRSGRRPATRERRLTPMVEPR